MNEKRKVKKRLLRLITLAIMALVMIRMTSIDKHVVAFINQIFPPESEQLHELSKNEKMEDFQYCYDTMWFGNPSITDYKETFGFSIADKYDEYLELIKKTETNYEFFCVMDAFVQDIPSFHTDLVFPENGAYYSLHCFGANRVNANRKTAALAMSWNETITEAITKYQDAVYYPYEYIDGAYYLLDSESNEEYLLTDVNDLSPDVYVTKAISTYRLWYDGQYSKPCRTQIVFNDTYGEAVSITVKDKNGVESKRNVYASLYAEEAYRLSETEQEDTQEDYTITNIGDICYVQMNNMLYPTCEALSRELKDNNHEKIILDLRENYGGNEDAVMKNLYPTFFADEKEEIKEWYMPSYGVNNIAYQDIFNRIVYRLSNQTDEYGNKIIVSRTRKVFKGDASNSNKKIIILISHMTGSAADEFVHISKGQDNVTVIGNNTGGEGLMGTYATDSCPNSRFVFVYMPSKAMLDEGDIYITTGTAPDIFVSNTIDNCKNAEDAVLDKAIQLLD